jgi:hypothetical protein
MCRDHPHSNNKNTDNKDIMGLKTTEFTLSQIKQSVYEGIRLNLENSDFKFKKSNFSFRRKHGNDYEIFYFLFYDYFPLGFNVHFLLESWNNEVERIKSALPYEQTIENFNFRSISIAMGDFIDAEEIKNQILKIRPFIGDTTCNFQQQAKPIDRKAILTRAQIDGYSFFIVSKDDLAEACNRLKALLNDKALPLSDLLATLSGINRFFESWKNWSVESLSLNNMATEIVSAKLGQERNYIKAYESVMSHINLLIKNSILTPAVAKVIEELDKFMRSK